LRERRDDIPLLIEHFLKEQAASQGSLRRLPAEIEDRFYQYDWPGNVRELQNKLKRYISTGRPGLSPPHSVSHPDVSKEVETLDISRHTLHSAVESLERRMISEVLTQNHWHKGNTAKILGIPRKTLQRKIAKYRL
jgi:DNA-binding NtrC family response regulator